MVELGVQTSGVVSDAAPEEGFALLREAGFSCADFSLNRYLTNGSLYRLERNDFFERTAEELERFFAPHRAAARAAGVRINQMHMPYPLLVPNGDRELNRFLRCEAAPKSLQICADFGCPYIVVHGLKLARYLGSEEVEWAETEKLLRFLAPTAKELGITICMENLYDQRGGRVVEGPGCDARKAAERIDRLNDAYGAEVLGFCFDTGHANLTGLDFEAFIKTLGHRLKVLHIHDNDGIGDLHQLPFAFTRNRESRPSTDWEGFIRGLRAIRFDGVLNFETAPVLTAFPEEMKRDVLSFIARTGAYFASAI